MGEQSVFERCGGFAAVRKVVSSFYDEVLDSPNLAPYFAGSDMASLIDHQTQFMSFVMGGPTSVSDEVLKRAHASLGITKAHFDELTGILGDVLEDCDIPPEDVDHVVAEIRSREHLIVSPGGSGNP
jgi:hemoglobin